MQVEGQTGRGDQSSIEHHGFLMLGFFPLVFFPSRNDMDDMIQKNPFVDVLLFFRQQQYFSRDCIFFGCCCFCVKDILPF